MKKITHLVRPNNKAVLSNPYSNGGIVFGGFPTFLNNNSLIDISFF